jgi:hypothetical protein
MKTTRHFLWLWMALAGLGSPVVAGATGDGAMDNAAGCRARIEVTHTQPEGNSHVV